MIMCVESNDIALVILLDTINKRTATPMMQFSSHANGFDNNAKRKAANNIKTYRIISVA